MRDEKCIEDVCLSAGERFGQDEKGPVARLKAEAYHDSIAQLSGFFQLYRPKKHVSDRFPTLATLLSRLGFGQPAAAELRFRNAA